MFYPDPCQKFDSRRLMTAENPRGAEVLVDHQPGQQPFLAPVASGHQLCLGLRGFGDAPTSGAPGDSRLGVQLTKMRHFFGI